MKIKIGSQEYTLVVESFEQYPRGVDGLCALCHGDPCAEDSPPESLIAILYREKPSTATCLVCEGRPS